MKASEVHNLKDDELVAKLIDAKQEAFNLRFRHATGELENTARLGMAKRDVARLLTVARSAASMLRKRRSGYERRRDEKRRDDRGDSVQDEAQPRSAREDPRPQAAEATAPPAEARG